MSIYHENTKIKNQSFKKEVFTDYEYECCTFTNCDFTEASLYSCNFIDCEFHDCNLALTKLDGTILNDVRFYNCKILGIHFDLCSSFIFDVFFKNCILDDSSFDKRKMNKTQFIDCSLKGTYFGDAQLKQAKFANCDLSEASFIRANLQEADFTTSYNYGINLEDCFVKKTRFSRDGLAGLLKNYDIIIEEI